MHAPCHLSVHPAHRALRVACVLVACLCVAGCTLLAPGPQHRQHWQVALPADVAAAVIAGALRIELQAEPIASACGAPVTVRAPLASARGNGQRDGHRAGDYEVAFVQSASNRASNRARNSARNHWLPLASHRISIRAKRHEAAIRHMVLTNQLPTALRGFASATATTATVQVRIVADPDGATPSSRVTLVANRRHSQRLLPILERTLRLAMHCDAGGPGLSEPNLAAWRLAELLRTAADAQHDDPRRGNLLRRAAQQPNAPSFVHAQLAELAQLEGRHVAAVQHWNCALLSETDPARRSQILRLRRHQSNPAANLRDDAMDRLLGGDTAQAEQLLHTARRRRAKPAADYHLLGYVHRQRGDDMAALAAELLAREHDEATAAPTSGAFARGQAGSAASFAPKLPAGVLPLRASATLYGPLRAAATPPRD